MKPLTIIQDTREQYEPPWSEGVTVERAGLPYGDYSAQGLTDVVSLELKWSIDDLAACCGRERDRFDTMLRGLTRYPVRALIVAATPADVAAHNYVSRMNPSSIIASTWAWGHDYGLPVIWARDAQGATKAIEWWLRRAAEKYADGPPSRIDDNLMREVRRCVREEMRTELLLCGMSEVPYHWTPQDRLALAQRLRGIVEQIDPDGGSLE